MFEEEERQEAERLRLEKEAEAAKMEFLNSESCNESLTGNSHKYKHSFTLQLVALRNIPLVKHLQSKGNHLFFRYQFPFDSDYNYSEQVKSNTEDNNYDFEVNCVSGHSLMSDNKKCEFE